MRHLLESEMQAPFGGRQLSCDETFDAATWATTPGLGIFGFTAGAIVGAAVAGPLGVVVGAGLGAGLGAGVGWGGPQLVKVMDC
jgi:hypothetical protein